MLSKAKTETTGQAHDLVAIELEQMKEVSGSWLARAGKRLRAATTPLCLGVVIMAMAVAAADELGVTLGGTYDYSVYHGAPKPQFSARYNFEASVAGCSWIIQYENTAAAT